MLKNENREKGKGKYSSLQLSLGSGLIFFYN